MRILAVALVVVAAGSLCQAKGTDMTGQGKACSDWEGDSLAVLPEKREPLVRVARIQQQVREGKGLEASRTRRRRR